MIGTVVSMTMQPCGTRPARSAHPDPHFVAFREEKRGVDGLNIAFLVMQHSSYLKEQGMVTLFSQTLKAPACPIHVAQSRFLFFR